MLSMKIKRRYRLSNSGGYSRDVDILFRVNPTMWELRMLQRYSMGQIENSRALTLGLSMQLRVRPSATGDMEGSDSHAGASLSHCVTFVYE